MTRALIFLASLALFYGQIAQAAQPAKAVPGAPPQPVVVDLSEDFVAITAGFNGTDVLLFGATTGIGEVVVVIVGPNQNATVRLKEKFAGIWVNGREVVFKDVPAFYQVLSTDTLDEWLPLQVREANQIGVEYLEIVPNGDTEPAIAADFRNALIRTKQAKGHYGKVENTLDLTGGRLFRSRVFFPADVPVGIYEINTYHVVDGRVISTQTIPLTISKTGFEAAIYRIAQQNGALYGIAAIIVAVLAGMAGNALFRRV
jgi:uncharacterized protein (TIGR02186 family)